ncbi:ESPR domain-containing protein [Escherichia coli]|uniref:ESPR domain-containing protein n=1 Tax=Escherichia coli TaxID=562 RepID=UPI0022268BCF|nr:ESPR domain-containing protein [Escherichia coli]MCW3280832.1 ESPR domain-containing protein [Escherichia coli]
MNRNCYRIIFNKARGMLMVVADIARSGRAVHHPPPVQDIHAGNVSAVSHRLHSPCGWPRGWCILSVLQALSQTMAHRGISSPRLCRRPAAFRR